MPVDRLSLSHVTLLYMREETYSPGSLLGFGGAPSTHWQCSLISFFGVPGHKVPSGRHHVKEIDYTFSGLAIWGKACPTVAAAHEPTWLTLLSALRICVEVLATDLCSALPSCTSHPGFLFPLIVAGAGTVVAAMAEDMSVAFGSSTPEKHRVTTNWRYQLGMEWLLLSQAGGPCLVKSGGQGLTGKAVCPFLCRLMVACWRCE